jgi:hypothetical protein
MLDKLMAGWKGRNKTPENKEEPNTELLNEYKEKLKGIVYDDELVEQFAPLFVKLHEHDPEGVMMELLESKEQQIQAIADGSAFKEMSPEQQEDIETNNGEEQPKESDFSVESFIVNRGK